jgi:hypothetical protein
MTETVSGFFAGTGRAAKFPVVGATVEGTVSAVHPPEPQTDFETRQPIPGKTQIRIELDTDLRDPDIDGDDGKRTLYVKGWMTGAIGEALRKAGAKEPLPGATLSVTRIDDAPPTRPGLQGPHRFTAVYSPSAGTFTKTTSASSSVNGMAPIPTQPPAGITQKAWDDMNPEAKQAIANTIAAGLT